MIAEGAENVLIHCSLNELRRHLIINQHVVEQVRLIVESRFDKLLDVFAAAQEDRTGIAGIVDHGGNRKNDRWQADRGASAFCCLGEEVPQAFFLNVPRAFAPEGVTIV